ncbi:MAG: alpha/beta hydrolase [Candidatus Melainabacteria bacterium]|nr:alpha/beta hydrolase [Candidatus Melainabacteria bacterium]
MVISNLAALGVVYAALSPRIATHLYGAMLFHPDKHPLGNYQIEQINGFERQEIFFAGVNGKQLHGWLFKNPATSKVILFSHGNAGNLTYRVELIRLLLTCGASVFVYDYQGYGMSKGNPSLKGICHDAQAAYDYLVNEQKVPAHSIILYGESLGGGVACELASRRPCAGIILQSAFVSLRRIGIEALPFVCIYPSWLFPKPELNALAFLQNEHPPVLILHGQRDEVVPFAHAQELYEQGNGAKYFAPLPNAGHSDLAEMEGEAYAKAVSAFLSRIS